MANHLSAKKRIRTTAKRTDNNSSRVSEMRTYVKKVESAIASGKKDEAKKALSAAESKLAKNARKGTIKRNAAARKVSRLVERIKAL